MDYEAYLGTSEWRQKKMNRLAYDNWQCAICHIPIDDPCAYHTHHMSYANLGNENVSTDIVTMCVKCHKDFHAIWSRKDFWMTEQSANPISHWTDYSLKDTAALCKSYLSDDYWFGGEYNLCSIDTIQGYIDRYFAEFEVTSGVRILETDVLMYVRNRRYDLIFASMDANEPMDDFLDRKFGKKGIKGGNRRRSEARGFYTNHKPGALKRIYKENENVLILMDEVKKMEGNT